MTDSGERVPISEARKRLSELCSLCCYQGREFVITRNGKPVARLVPPRG